MIGSSVSCKVCCVLPGSQRAVLSFQGVHPGLRAHCVSPKLAANQLSDALNFTDFNMYFDSKYILILSNFQVSQGWEQVRDAIKQKVPEDIC